VTALHQVGEKRSGAVVTSMDAGRLLVAIEQSIAVRFVRYWEFRLSSDAGNVVPCRSSAHRCAGRFVTEDYPGGAERFNYPFNILGDMYVLQSYGSWFET
jgi:hypothetical protein